jgi:hypothetical protein
VPSEFSAVAEVVTVFVCSPLLLGGLPGLSGSSGGEKIMSQENAVSSASGGETSPLGVCPSPMMWQENAFTIHCISPCTARENTICVIRYFVRDRAFCRSAIAAIGLQLEPSTQIFLRACVALISLRERVCSAGWKGLCSGKLGSR